MLTNGATVGTREGREAAYCPEPRQHDRSWTLAQLIGRWSRVPSCRFSPGLGESLGWCWHKPVVASTGRSNPNNGQKER
jgi:hypothetical protein